MFVEPIMIRNYLRITHNLGVAIYLTSRGAVTGYLVQIVVSKQVEKDIRYLSPTLTQE